ncbi:MAG: RNA-binding protein [Butyricicoccus sp.]|nr:RNA-binding protein [Butyricicoccus sp.]
MRDKILRLAQDGDDRLLLAGVLDKLETCRSRNYMTSTRFLDMRERALVQQAVRMAGAGRECVFWGGYPDAERTCAVFFPDYMTADDVLLEDNSPVALVRAEKHAADTLTHRDYLGALMGLQIKREHIGDILVSDAGAEILVLRDMADFVQMNFAQAGRKRVSTARVPLADIRIPEVHETAGEGSVASLRLDSLIALIFSLPRGDAQAYITKGLVFVNQQPCLKPGRDIDVGDRITVRGKGRARILSLGGTSRKGRQFVRYARS